LPNKKAAKIHKYSKGIHQTPSNHISERPQN